MYEFAELFMNDAEVFATTIGVLVAIILFILGIYYMTKGLS